MEINEPEFHVHKCRKCKAEMKHYHSGGCNMKTDILCDTCSLGREFLNHEREDQDQRGNTKNR